MGEYHTKHIKETKENGIKVHGIRCRHIIIGSNGMELTQIVLMRFSGKHGKVVVFIA